MVSSRVTLSFTEKFGFDLLAAFYNTHIFWVTKLILNQLPRTVGFGSQKEEMLYY